jgi:hypothetical protein
MQNRVIAVIAGAVLICLAPLAGHALTPYGQDFEALFLPDFDALANDGWLVFGNVFTPEGGYLYGYGPYPAPNHALAFSAIVTGEGGPDQGAQQLVVFSDYESAEHDIGNIVEANVFQEQQVGPADVGTTWIFRFQSKMGNLEGSSTAAAFIKTLDPDAGYELTNFFTADMTNIPTTWGGDYLVIEIDPSLDGQILQFGFMNTASNYEGSGIYYDNVAFYQYDPTAVPADPAPLDAALRQNYPNPFNPTTRIEFALDQPGSVDVAVFDVTGRRVATLRRGDLAAGEHSVTWNGQTDDGKPVAAGQYWCVLQTPAGRASRGMTLVK